MDDVQALLERIQKSVVAEAEQKFADETFQHLRYSLHNGLMRDPDAVASLTGDCGEIMRMYVKFRGNRVESVKYITDGDASSCLCGSCTAELAIGKTTEQLMEIRASEVIKRVRRGGEGFEKCALLAVETLHKVVENYWMARTDSAVIKKRAREPRFLPVRKGSSHMQYSN
jgi:nitrogen fixation NifU-like protein